ncbi:hypothetical protein GMORB2_2964 [Geosmithia morbida]|uniref:Uncharacterized protein n=1 Tax=Geosmithia morbida TaxID=1094350 RepID=A0A9P5D1J3_9HYPO|nr:uncharacterized protein GMORB2_2964 [Geosmithia morbida]KAF4120526.1 hypothetical protein GMORB2_2964 [Geosmithia morbida]
MIQSPSLFVKQDLSQQVYRSAAHKPKREDPALESKRATTRGLEPFCEVTSAATCHHLGPHFTPVAPSV